MPILKNILLEKRALYLIYALNKNIFIITYILAIFVKSNRLVLPNFTDISKWQDFADLQDLFHIHSFYPIPYGGDSQTFLKRDPF